jgi:GNAT superfamily N-acetyltransferase
VSDDASDGGFVVAPLSAEHDRASFTCGVAALDRYLKTQAAQDGRRYVANTFVIGPTGSRTIAGFYTLAAAAIPSDGLPAEMRARLPRYKRLPAALVGRLAVDTSFRRRGIGRALVFDALERAMRSDPAVFALLVEAKDDAAAEFYRRNDFRPLVDEPLRLFLPLATVAKLT